MFHIFPLIFIYCIVNLLMLCDEGVACLLLHPPCATLVQLGGFIKMRTGLPPLSFHPPPQQHFFLPFFKYDFQLCKPGIREREQEKNMA